MTLLCGDCGANMKLIHGMYGKFYGCTRYPACKGVHSAHQATGAPMGTPADKETREWRVKAHAKFDPFVAKRFESRKEGYKFLQKAMGLQKKDAHISRFDIKQCQELLEILKKKKHAKTI